MKFPAEHFEAANVIAMLVGEEDAIELARRDSALFEAKDELARAQAAIDQEPAMIGRDERAISGAAAAEHGQCEHASISSGRPRVSQIGNDDRRGKFSSALRSCTGTIAPPPSPHETIVLSILIGAVAFFQPATTRADEATHRKAVESLFALMGMEAVLTQSIDQMLAMQVQQNPALVPHQAQMKAFLSRYMSWASMKDDMAKLYMAEFSESELNELTKFYQTPVGKKTIQKMPALMAKGAEMDRSASRNICRAAGADCWRAEKGAVSARASARPSARGCAPSSRRNRANGNARISSSRRMPLRVSRKFV